MQSNNTSSEVNILGTRAVCPFIGLPKEFESYRDGIWAYVEFLIGDEKHLPNSTAWIPLSLAKGKSRE